MSREAAVVSREAAAVVSREAAVVSREAAVVSRETAAVVSRSRRYAGRALWRHHRGGRRRRRPRVPLRGALQAPPAVAPGRHRIADSVTAADRAARDVIKSDDIRVTCGASDAVTIPVTVPNGACRTVAGFSNGGKIYGTMSPYEFGYRMAKINIHRGYRDHLVLLAEEERPRRENLPPEYFELYERRRQM